ncbi:transporter [Fulvivirgaceae bacterium BMA10]|uniref:Transporter n=1 Tax=Splendidivirga corallicola TaxID=3051826 RepID=A0ABT8KUP5_9BACT|nr:transporter [Fulvivirgaceae bacterium BMA10]
MNKFIKSVIIIVLCLLSVSSFAGGGWTQKKGKGFFKLGFWWINSDRYYTPNGQIIPIVTTGIYNTSIYGEYGFTDRLTGVVYLPFFSRATLNEQVAASTGELLAPGDASNTIGDTDISLKYGLIQNKPFVLSATLTLGLPLGSPTGGDTKVLQTGDGEFNQMITLDASRSFGKVPVYISASVGFNNRTENFSDEIRIGAEAGYTFKQKLTLIARIYNLSSLENGDDSETQANGVFSNNTEFFTFSPEVVYNFNEQWGASVSYGKAFSGKRILASPSYSFGVFFKL